MSRFRSTFSRMRVELMSSRWGGSWSWMTLPVMGRSSGRGALPARRKMMWFMEWMDQSGAGPDRRSVGYHVAARHQVHLLIGEQLPQALQVCGVGDVHRDLVGEQVHMEVPGDGQVDNLPADQVGLGLLGPGELVHRQIDLKAQVPDGVDNALWDRVKGSKVRGKRRSSGAAGRRRGRGPAATGR